MSMLDTPTGTATAALSVHVGGSPLKDDSATLLVSAEARSNLLLPDSFSLAFIDLTGNVLQESGLRLKTMVELRAGESQDVLVQGEVTSMELEYAGGNRTVVVSGYDLTHRMMSGTRSKAYSNVSASDIAKELAKLHGMTEGTIDETSPVYDVVTQANQSDWAFLQELAARHGMDAYGRGKKLYFCKPEMAKEEPPLGDLGSSPVAGQLLLGENLVRLRMVVTSTEQVGQVEVRGWDPTIEAALIGTSAVEPVSSKSEDAGANPEAVANEMDGRKLVVTDVPVDKQQAADALAKGVAARIAGAFTELEGECYGAPTLFAGKVVSLANAGHPFDGHYVITSAVHRLTTAGFRTEFRVSGQTDRSLFSLTSGTGATSPTLGRSRIPGIVTGIVSNANDPKALCRVKLKFPWLDETYESDWAPTVQPGADQKFGSVIVPEVGSEVLVAFDHGDPQRPYVLGNVYNGKRGPHVYGSALVDGQGKVGERTFTSRLGNAIAILEEDGGSKKAGINLMTKDDKCQVLLNDGNDGTKITVDSQGDVEITASKNITIKAGQKLALTASEVSIEATAGNVAVQAASQLSMKGTAGATLEGATVKVSADAEASVAAAIVKLGS